MPWSSTDAKRHTRKAKSAKQRRQWAHVANSALRRTGAEGRAVAAANSVLKKGGKPMYEARGRRGRKRGKKHR